MLQFDSIHFEPRFLIHLNQVNSIELENKEEDQQEATVSFHSAAPFLFLLKHDLDFIRLTKLYVN